MVSCVLLPRTLGKIAGHTLGKRLQAAFGRFAGAYDLAYFTEQPRLTGGLLSDLSVVPDLRA